jgi:hypothetical protein
MWSYAISTCLHDSIVYCGIIRGGQAELFKLGVKPRHSYTPIVSLLLLHRLHVFVCGFGIVYNVCFN